jgi:photosystem II stability/assembly factor-like uncharacterized protein
MMKSFFSHSGLAVVLTFFFSSVNAQHRTYKDMMDDHSINFYDVVKTAEAHFDTAATGKGSGYKGYLRWKHMNEARYFPTGKRDAVSSQWVAEQYVNTIQNTHSKTGFPDGWKDLGPYDANNITSHYSAGIGRVETFYVNPENPDLIYLGSRSGGFWRTEDEGKTWENTTDYLVASGVNTITVHPKNPDRVWINVQNANNQTTHGIYTSSDGGKTWVRTQFNPDNLNKGGLGSNFRVYKIVVHPRVDSLIFIGASDGLYRSTDSLATWERVTGGQITDIEFHPTNDDIIYAANNYYWNNGRNALYRSENGGESFQTSALIQGNNNQRGYIAVTPQNPKIVYFASTSGVFKSEDEGKSFSYLGNAQESCFGFAVNDQDTNIMVYGYVDAHASSDEAKNFSKITSWSRPFDPAYIHADIRTLECMNGVFYVGTDGYLCKSTDNGKTWTKLNDGTGIREFYRSGISQSNFYLHMSGSQDNGTSILKEEGWIEWNGGDGMEAVVQSLNDDWMIGSWQFGQRQRTKDGGMTRHGISHPEGGSGQADWIAPLFTGNVDQMKVFHCGRKVYLSEEFGTGWELIGDPILGGTIQQGAIAYNDDNTFVLSRQNRIKLTTDGGESFTEISNFTVKSSLTDIGFDPNDDQTIIISYASYSNDGEKVFITHDQGKTWQNITYNLGNMPIRSVAIDHQKPAYIYVGAEIGIYYKRMDETEWTLYNPNLPNVAVLDLDLHEGSNTIKATTWGRGLWEYSWVNRDAYPDIMQVDLLDAPTDELPSIDIKQHVSAEVEYDGTIDKVYLVYGVNSLETTNAIEMEMDGKHWKTKEPLPNDAVGDRVYFRVIAVGSNQDTTRSYRFMYTIRPEIYCGNQPETVTGLTRFITNVALKGVSHSSAQEGHGKFADVQFVAAAGKVNQLEVTIQPSLIGRDSVIGWADYDGNGTLDSDERIFFTRPDASGKAYANWVVPGMVELKKRVRLRIAVGDGLLDNFINSCGIFDGEVEDYSFIVSDDVAFVANTFSEPVAIYPNPTFGSVTIELPSIEQNVEVRIMNLNGVLIENRRFEGVRMIHWDNLPSGMYYISILTPEKMAVKKLVVE